MSNMPRATELDKKIGKKIRELRLAKGLSRNSIAEAVGVTHQQFVKYESGANRLSISRLLAISKVLEVVPSYFYSEQQDSASAEAHDVESQPRLRMNLELARNLQGIDNREIQDALLHLTKKIANYLRTNKENEK